MKNNYFIILYLKPKNIGNIKGIKKDIFKELGKENP